MRLKRSVSIPLKRMLFFFMFFVLSYASPGFTAEHTIVKMTGTQITIPTFNAGDTLVITGDALETTPDDWGKLQALSKNFALIMKNAQASIPDFALDRSNGLVSLDLSELTDLTVIGRSAFEYSTKLAAINFSGLSRLETIGNGSFWGCSALKKVDLSEVPMLRTIEERAFSNCTALQTLNLSGLDRLESIGNFSFDECKALSEVNFSGVSNLTLIGFGAFGYCDGLISIDLSPLKNLTTISSRAFNYSRGLKTVNLSGLSRLQTIGSYAFTSCSALEEVVLTGVTGLTSIGGYAFTSCAALTGMDFTQLTGLTLIETGAFQYCSSLTTVDLSGLSQLTEIKGSAFSGCTDLKTIKLFGVPKLNSISSSAFYGALELEALAIDRETPPSLSGNPLDNTNESPIYVPPHLVNTYKSAWTRYAHRIQGMQEAITPVAAPPGGAYREPQRVSLASETPSALIYYTLDGSDPITNPNGTRRKYTGPLVVALDSTLKAFAQSPITTPSAVMTEIYMKDNSGGGGNDGGNGGGGSVGIVATPVATPAGGAFEGPQIVTLATSTSGASIYFTLDCSDPMTSPTRQLYTAPITVSMGTLLKAYAVKAGMYDSGLLMLCFTQKKSVEMPMANPPGGAFRSAQRVYLSTETLGALIHYTLDGSDPITDPNRTRQTYVKPLDISLGTTLKAYATRDGYVASAVLTESYTIASDSCADGDGGGCNGGFGLSNALLLLVGMPLLRKRAQ